VKGEVTLTMKQWRRFDIIRSALEEKMTTRQAAQILSLSKRQVQRLKKRVREKGPSGVLHGNKDRKPPHAFSPELKDQVAHLVKTTYFDFNFSHLSEMLMAEHNLRINRETLRRWLRPLGFGRKPRKKPPHRTKRNRSTQHGQMLFLDGSPHQWFDSRASTLILCTDDATGQPLYGLFQDHEDLTGCLRVCLEVFTTYGLPHCFYLDRASHFTTTRHGGIHRLQHDHNPTQFERAMDELGIRLIFAHSPQARGRAERIHGTFQDRLVAELRLKGIQNHHQATRYLNEQFIPTYSRRFALKPENPSAAWRPLPPHVDMRTILCKRFQRTVKNDNTISVRGQIIQLLPTASRRHFVKAKVQVHQWIDGSWHVFHPKHGELPCTLLTQKQRAA
jgi:transposase